MRKTKYKLGDIFEVKINDNSKKYFQLIAVDLLQLNSEVIRAFKKEYPISYNYDFSEIINGKIEFYAHCITKLGVKLGYWEKVGNIDDVGDATNIVFRDTNDYGSSPGKQVKVSHNWYVWKINDIGFTRVGKLIGENQSAEIGIVISPDSIVYRMQYGEYDFVYPGY